MLPPIAKKKIKAWIRSRHLIYSEKSFLFETMNYAAIERFEECLESLGGTLISVETIKRVWIGTHRQIFLYQAKGTLNNPHHELIHYWYENGDKKSRFNETP